MADIRLINLSNYVRPKIEENKSKNWVQNGRENSFYQYIIDRYNGSVTNAAINKSYTDLIYGRGIFANDAHLKANDWAAFKALLNKNELKKIIADFQLFNEAAIQVVKTKDKKKVAGIYHLPKNLVIPSLENEDGEIESYWYSKNWSKLSQNPPEEFKVLGTSKDEIEVYVIKPYMAGCNYFANPDYMAGLPWAELEEEIGNFCNRSIKQGLSAGYVINVPDGAVMTPEEKDELEKKIKAKLSGSPNAMNFVISFNSKEMEINIIPFPVNDQQHKQWDYLTVTSREMIMGAHRVVSPMLFGIKDNAGLGNNAEELDTAEAQMMKRIVAPKQQYIIEALQDIISINSISLDLYFKPLTESNAKPMQMASDEKKKNLDTSVADELIALGEEAGEDWELVETKLIEDYSTDVHFNVTSTGTAIPNAKSVIDGEQFKTRFRYTGSISQNSRPFCVKMLNANKLYRLEDIQRMSNKVVNEGWGPNGTDTYDIFLYKGGGNCKHVWSKEVYRIKADVNSPLADKITPGQAKGEGEKLPATNSKAATRPADMVNNGFLKPR